MSHSEENILPFLIKEYEKLKDEQHKRIEFRDHMIYLTLGAIGAVFSFALEKPELNFAYLVLPFICLVLGWTYLSNDEKISSIGKYFRKILIPKLKQISATESTLLDNTWEDFIRTDLLRKKRKIFQLFIDLSIFCFSGIISIIVFLVASFSFNWYYFLIIGFEVICIIHLILQFIKYADLK